MKNGKKQVHKSATGEILKYNTKVEKLKKIMKI